MQRVFRAVLVPQVEVAEDGVGAVDLTRGARKIEVVGEDVAKRGLDLTFFYSLPNLPFTLNPLANCIIKVHIPVQYESPIEPNNGS